MFAALWKLVELFDKPHQGGLSISILQSAEHCGTYAARKCSSEVYPWRSLPPRIELHTRATISVFLYGSAGTRHLDRLRLFPRCSHLVRLRLLWDYTSLIVYGHYSYGSNTLALASAMGSTQLRTDTSLETHSTTTQTSLPRLLVVQGRKGSPTLPTPSCSSWELSALHCVHSSISWPAVLGVGAHFASGVHLRVRRARFLRRDPPSPLIGWKVESLTVRHTGPCKR